MMAVDGGKLIPQRGARTMAEGKLRTVIAHVEQPFVDEPFYSYPAQLASAVRTALGIKETRRPVLLGHVRTTLNWVKP